MADPCTAPWLLPPFGEPGALPLVFDLTDAGEAARWVASIGSTSGGFGPINEIYDNSRLSGRANGLTRKACPGDGVMEQ